jgi:aminoglycoside 6-adenylyltransferase
MTSDPTLSRLADWAEKQPTVRAALLNSSRACPSARVDQFSDYDVIFFVDDVRLFFQDEGWLAEFGQVLAIYRNPIGLEDGFESFGFITHFEDGPKIDFTFTQADYLGWAAAQPSLPPDLDLGYLILLDKDGMASGLRPPTYQAYILQPPNEATYQSIIQEFFNDALYVGKHLRRDDLIPAKYNLDYICKYQLLRRMLEWHAASQQNWSVRMGTYGKGLQQQVDTRLWAAFEKTYVGPEAAENWQALFETLELFQESAAAVGQALGYTYPHDQHGRIVQALDKIRGQP